MRLVEVIISTDKHCWHRSCHVHFMLWITAGVSIPEGTGHKYPNFGVEGALISMSNPKKQTFLLVMCIYAHGPMIKYNCLFTLGLCYQTIGWSQDSWIFFWHSGLNLKLCEGSKDATVEWRLIGIQQAPIVTFGLFACLVFNGTFSTNSLYRATEAWRISHRAGGQDKHIMQLNNERIH